MNGVSSGRGPKRRILEVEEMKKKDYLRHVENICRIPAEIRSQPALTLTKSLIWRLTQARTLAEQPGTWPDF
jgi:hypothetical protein